ncbi:AGE family epimerase/isomerase [Paraglaciecola sp.]|uniref:AGE family epimerase/isomerase n=1 Tax=Paraglaciecola sp. TaxID=1920173 RepID=UPI003EF5A4E8
MKQFNHFDPEGVLDELKSITHWWQTNTIDKQYGGFVGEVCSDGVPQQYADKGIILNSRILWFFSELAVFYGVETEQGQNALQTAQRSYTYIIEHFDDHEFGGALWKLSYTGDSLNDKKQTYAQCFCIYAFSAFYIATQNEQALTKALEYFDLVEQHARDKQLGGYIEAYQRDWQPIEDFRLSDKDMNTPKSMNTHLHVLEAYAALYRVAPSTKTEEALRHILDMFEQHILDHKTGHLKLFFTQDWQDQSDSLSFGHDIEASWLIWEAVEILGDDKLIQKWKPFIVHMAMICSIEAIGERGQVCEELDKNTQHKNQDSYWWVQAEALVGLLNTYHLTGDKYLFTLCENIWQFIQRFQKDSTAGEWHWLARVEGHENQNSYKAGFWKAPYHNGRAMMEVIKLFDKIQAE